jgi:hypothetical protein
MATSHKPTTSSSSLDTSKEERLLENIGNHIHGPVDRLVVFDDKVIQKSARVINRHAVNAPTPGNLLQCFLSFGTDHLEEALNSWHVQTSTSEGVTDLFLETSARLDPDAETSLSNVQAIGQLCLNDSVTYQEGLLRLCGHAQRAFKDQPTRRHLHGLYVRKALVEACIFDRSGICCHQSFNWQEEYLRFTSLALNYRFMTAGNLGMSGIIKNDPAGNYITLDNTMEPMAKNFIWKMKLLRTQRK